MFTNVVPLCDVRSLEWCIYETKPVVYPATEEEGDHEPSQDVEMNISLTSAMANVSSSSSFSSSSSSNRPMEIILQHLRKRNVLCTIENTCTTEESDGKKEEKSFLWLFVLNERYTAPSEEEFTAIKEFSRGKWIQEDENSLPSQVLSLFFQSVEKLLSKKLLQGEFFLDDDGFFVVNDPQLEYRAPSLSRLNDYEEYLKEALPMPSFQLYFDLKYHDCKMLLMVGVDMALKEKDAHQEGDEIGNPLRSWDRLFKLPSIDNPCAMMDVWHIDDALAPRIVAETKYADVAPRFRHIVKKSKKKLGTDEPEPGAAEEAKEDGAKTGERDEDEDDHAGDDDDEEEYDNGTDTLMARKRGQGKKRKRNKGKNEDNEESVAPVSPDTHVNSPSAGLDANGNELASGRSMIIVTYPKEHHQSNRKTWLRSDPNVHHYRRPKLRKKKKQVSHLVTFCSTNSVEASASSSLNEGSKSLQESVPTISNKLNITSRNSFSSNSMIDDGKELNVTQQQKAAQVIGRIGSSCTASNSLSPSTVVQGVVANRKDLSIDGCEAALDPVHPVLKALAAEVDKDMTNFCSGSAKENQVITASKYEYNMVSNAAMYLPSINSTVPPEYKYLTRSIIEQVSRQYLLSDKLQQKLDIYSKDLTRYGPRIKNGLDAHKLQQNQQRLLLSFEPQQLLTEQQPLQDCKNVIRNEEIEMGLKLSAKDALVQSCRGKESCSRMATRTWLMEEVIGKRPTEAALESDRNRLAGRVLSYIDMISSFLQAKGQKDFKQLRFGRKWLTLAQYAAVVSNDVGNMVEKSHSPPDFSLSNTDSCFSVPACYVSEWIYRDFHPVSAPKPVDYVVICPSSPKEWLGSLTLSYVQAFKSMYTQCRLGDQLPIELKHLVNNPYVHVGDSSLGLMVVDCATSQDDAFQTYRKAGEMLRSVIGPNAKKNQAFGRCAIANVVYLVAPFRRGDVKHEMWMRGAVAKGLGFDLNSTDVSSTGWQNGIVFEIIFLDELYRVGLTAPSLGGFALMGDCMALYDKVYEKTNLQPCTNTTTGNNKSLTENDRARFICERTFHLASGEKTDPKDRESIEPGEEQSSKNTTSTTTSIQAHAGYTLSTDGRWLLVCFSDRLGSVLESHVIDLHDGNTQEDSDIGWNKGFLFAWERMLSFYALFGEKGVLILSKKDQMTEKEQQTWSKLAEKMFGEKDLDPNLSKYATLINQICLVEVVALRTIVEKPELNNNNHRACSQRVQIRYQEDGLRQTRITTAMQSLHGREPIRKSFIVFPMDANSKVRSGMIVTTPHEKLLGTRVTAMLNTQCFGGYCKKREELTFRVDCLKTFGRKEQEEEEATKVKWTMEELLENFVDLSWLTIHPVTLERASPWPLHLASVQVMETNVTVLGQQLEQR